ncbi:MAG TPA: DUF2875 family protein, partial [Dyella sp.]|uniref:type VI lipase adapter Tla3 domain-containing protein n=1 Tax=Dyella sp. TaxID=1869338 RepID=UPI002B972CE9
MANSLLLRLAISVGVMALVLVISACAATPDLLVHRAPNADQSLSDTLGAASCFKSPSLYSTGADDVYAASSSAKDASSMNASPLYRAPTTSPHLETLDIVSVGLSLDVYRQGQVWGQMQQQDARQSNSLHVGSILPTDPAKYPVTVDTKNMAYDQRKADALELALKDFREAWPIPTVTVVRGWNSGAANPRVSHEAVKETLQYMVEGLRPEAGLHWHEIHQLPNGVICSDTPEDVVEDIFRTFEGHPDLPAMLVYVVEGYNMAGMLSTKDQALIGVGNGPRQPGELTDAMVALVVARPERVNWLRGFVKYTKPPPGHSIYPGFTFWDRQPPMTFRASPFIPEPWTALGFKQWDAMKTLA